MSKIKLTQGKYALVDPDDFEYLNQWKWFAHKRRDVFYAERNLRQPNGKYKTVSMHRIIMNTPGDMETDHKNGNPLDNRKINLRVCTASQNMANRRLFKSAKLGYKGIILVKGRKSKPYLARIYKDLKTIYLGYHATAEEAAKAYDNATKKYFGEYGRVNIYG